MKIQVTLDGEKLELKGDFKNLEDVFTALLNKLIEKERMVTEVYLNGEPYTERWYRESKDIPIEEVKDLKIITKTPKELARLALKGSVEAIEHLKNALLNVSELYRIGDDMEANEQLANCFDALRAFLNVVDNSRNILKMDNGSSPVEGEGYEEFMERFSEILDEIEEGQNFEDWLLVADVIEYELIPHLERWKNVASSFGI